MNRIANWLVSARRTSFKAGQDSSDFQLKGLSAKCTRLWNSSVLAISLCFFSFNSTNVADAQASKQLSPKEVRQQFRSFYEPLLPKLQASYSNVRYLAAGRGKMERQVRVTFYRGAISGSDFLYESFEPVWVSNGNMGIGLLKPLFKDDSQFQEAGGRKGDVSYQVLADSYAGDSIRVFRDEQIGSLYFEHSILMPTVSPKLGITFEQIMNDDRFECVEFLDETKDRGQRVKTLYYRPPNGLGNDVFAASFDPGSGACLHAIEYEVDESLIVDPEDRGSIHFQMIYYEKSDDERYWPAPQICRSSEILSEPVLFLEYERAGELDENDISVSRFGFDESELEIPQSWFEKIKSGSTNILIVIAIVLIAMLFFLVCLMVLIKMLAGSLAKPESASGRSSTDELDSANDLSE